MEVAAVALAALLTFNAEIVRLRGTERIFLGAQLGEGDPGVYAWTKCLPESGVFVIQASEHLVTLPMERVQFIARHEIAHVRLHSKVICSGEYASLLPARKREMENEADRLAGELRK